MMPGVSPMLSNSSPPRLVCARFNGAKAKLFGLETLIPIHYEQDVWSHLKEGRASYEGAFQDPGLAKKVMWRTKGVPTQLSVTALQARLHDRRGLFLPKTIQCLTPS
jgi:hypothetical protein